MDPMRFALHLKLRKLDDTGILAVILLHELLLKQGQKNLELVQGYLTVMGETCWHVWIAQNETVIIDLGRIIATLKDPAFENCKFSYSLEKPEGDVTTDEQNLNIWESRNDKLFWKNAPKKFLEFRSKCHSRVHVRE
jgi:hypothetical protein